MSLVSYILTSILLTWVGLAAYLPIRWMRPPLAMRRAMLWLVVVLSLLLPLLPLLEPGAAPASAPAKDLHSFCHCTDPGARELIHYQSSRLNDLLLDYRGWVWGAFSLILGAVLLRFGISLLRLARLIRRHAAERVEVEGRPVRLVRGFPGLQAGALRLGGRFIFWHQALDALPENERRAILLHEYAHLRQGNTLERLLLGLAQCVWFLNPAYYFIRRELIQISELQADRYVVSRTSDAKGYALLLLKMKTQPALALIPLYTGGKLKARVAAILKPAPSRLRPGIALVAALALLIPGQLFAERAIEQQIRNMAVYEFLCDAHEQTGQEDFCRKCTYEAVDACL